MLKSAVTSGCSVSQTPRSENDQYASQDEVSSLKKNIHRITQSAAGSPGRVTAAVKHAAENPKKYQHEAKKLISLKSETIKCQMTSPSSLPDATAKKLALRLIKYNKYDSDLKNFGADKTANLFNLQMLNKTIPFAECPGKKIACRHLSLQFARDANNHVSGEVDLEKHYTRIRDIAAHIPYTLDAEYFRLMCSPPAGTCVVAIGDFGRVLNNLFRGMEKNQKNHDALLLHSSRHTLAVALNIDPKRKNAPYKVKVYDPNQTGQAESHTSSDPSGFPGLSGFLKACQFVPDYFMGEGSVAFVPLSSGGYEGMNADCSPPDTRALLLQLSLGLAEDIRKQIKIIEISPESERAGLLRAEDQAGNPGLFMALQHGHAEAVTAWFEGLARVPESERAGLLRAEDQAGIPGLSMALQNGHAEAVAAWREGLKWVPESARAGLLRAEEQAGIPGLYMALQQGHAEAVTAWLEGLARVPESERAGLLRAESKAGIPGLSMALQQGHAEAVTAWLEGLARVPESERAGLLRLLR